jgi:hypothetical protein
MRVTFLLFVPFAGHQRLAGSKAWFTEATLPRMNDSSRPGRPNLGMPTRPWAGETTFECCLEGDLQSAPVRTCDEIDDELRCWRR